MAHELEINAQGKASFAFRIEGGIPWHRLGTPMQGYQTLDDMMAAAHADYQVDLVPMFVEAPDGSQVEVKNQYATARINPHTGAYQVIHGGHTARYTVMQNRETAEAALAVVAAAKGDAVFDCMGVLYDGAQFFVTLALEPVFLDAGGVNDEIGRFLVVRSSHDGSVPLVFSNTDVRAVCKNTVVLGEQTAKRIYKVKHTPNMADRVALADTVLGISAIWREAFERTAMEMMGIDMTPGKFDRVIDSVFPEDEATTDRKKENRDKTVGILKALYTQPTNAGKVGNNGWAAWNTVVEFLDHHRAGSTADERALTSMDDTSWVTRAKVTAQQAVLALA